MEERERVGRLELGWRSKQESSSLTDVQRRTAVVFHSFPFSQSGRRVKLSECLRIWSWNLSVYSGEVVKLILFCFGCFVLCVIKGLLFIGLSAFAPQWVSEWRFTSTFKPCCKLFSGNNWIKLFNTKRSADNISPSWIALSPWLMKAKENTGKAKAGKIWRNSYVWECVFWTNFWRLNGIMSGHSSSFQWVHKVVLFNEVAYLISPRYIRLLQEISQVQTTNVPIYYARGIGVLRLPSSRTHAVHLKTRVVYCLSMSLMVKLKL